MLTRNPLTRATGPASVEGLSLIGVGIVASAALIAFAFINAPAVENAVSAVALLMLTALSARLYGVIGGEVAGRKELQRELTAAQQVQRSLAPDGLPLDRRFDIAGCNRMCRDVGGDYYDAFFVGHDQLLMVIADVSGKGAAAALVTASVQAIVRTHAASCQLRELATLLDRHLQRFGGGHYVTSVLLRLDVSSGDLAYVNAGHNPPLVISSGFVSALGLLDDAMFTDSSFTLPTDSVLVLYTDAVTERRGAGDSEYGDARLLAAIQTGCRARRHESLARSFATMTASRSWPPPTTI